MWPAWVVSGVAGVAWLAPAWAGSCGSQALQARRLCASDLAGALFLEGPGERC